MTKNTLSYMKNSFVQDKKTQAKKILYWQILLVTVFVFCDMFDDFRQDLITIANNYTRDFPTDMAIKKQTKGLHLNYSYKSVNICNKIIKHAIVHSSSFFKDPMCMCVINRNNIQFKKTMDQILIFDLCAKSLQQQRNISTPNAFTIYDIGKLTIKDMETLVLEPIKKYNHNVDILFCDEFGILNHQLVSEKLFYDIVRQKNNFQHIKFYYLYKDTNTIEDFISSYKIQIEIFLDNYLKYFRGKTYEILQNQNTFQGHTRNIFDLMFLSNSFNSFSFDNDFIKVNHTRSFPNLRFYRKIYVTINGIAVDVVLYLQNDIYTQILKSKIQIKRNIETLLVIDIQHHSLNHIVEFKKKIEIVTIKEKTEVENVYKPNIIIYEDNVYTNPIEYLLSIKENQIVSDISNNTKINNTHKNFELMVFKLKNSLNTIFKHCDTTKNKFHIATRHWIGNESIILQGRKKIYQTILKIKNKAELYVRIAKLIMKMKNDSEMRNHPMFFDLLSNISDSRKFCNYFISTNIPFYTNLAINSELRNRQKYFNCFGYQLTKDYKNFTNNIHMFVIPSAVFEYNSYDSEKRINLFKNKIYEKFTCYTETQKVFVQPFLECFLDDECIQDIPINLLFYLLNTNDFKKFDLETIFERIHKQRLAVKSIQKDSTLTESSLRYISLRKLLLELLLWSIDEMINDLFLASYNKESVIIFQNEFDYFEDDFDKIIAIANNFFKPNELEGDATQGNVEGIRRTDDPSLSEEAAMEEEASTSQEPEKKKKETSLNFKTVFVIYLFINNKYFKI